MTVKEYMELPGCHSDGETEEARKNLKEAMNYISNQLLKKK